MSFLTRKIINFDDRFFSLDLSDLSVKTLQLERMGSIDKIRSFSALAVPSGYIEDGNILDKEKTAQLIKEAVRKAGPKKINTNKVICSIPESKAFLRIINIPKVNKEEVREAVKWELEANIPLTSDQVYFGWQILSEGEGKLNVLTVAVAKEIIDTLVGVLTLAGLDAYGLEVDSIASTRSLIPADCAGNDTYLIADVGARRTGFIIAEGTIPYFTSSVPFSSEIISDTIAGNLSLNKKEAEKIKIDHGIEHSFKSNSVFMAVKPMMENLAAEIEKTVDFYLNISKNSTDIKKIILTGGGANLRGIVPYLTTRLSREITVGDPWVNVNLGNNLPIIDKEAAVRYATAIGLALKKIDYGNYD